MSRPSGEKTRCGGQWTEAKYKGFIKSTLRQATRKWGPINQCTKDARVSRGVYLCAGCKEEITKTTLDPETRKRVNNVHVDHIEPVVDPEEGFTTWDECIERMFSEVENLQVLCTPCHKAITAEENVVRKNSRGFYGTNPREYQTYTNMKGRCNNPRKSDYQYYGGRGIEVCPAWLNSFPQFLEDMGPRPEGATLDRVDVDGPYSPENCRWADWETQCNNKRNSVYIEWDGKRMSLSQWAKQREIGRATLAYRIKSGWSIEEALEFKDRDLEKAENE